MLDRCYLAAALPTLIVWGGRDSVIPIAARPHRPRGHARQPAGDLRRSGHFPHHDEPARFVAVVEDFLDRTSPALYDPVSWRRMLRDGRADEPATALVDPHLSSGA